MYDFTEFCGSLSTLKNVEELTIHISDPFSIKHRCRLIPFLPVESSHCLSRLHFDVPTDFDDYDNPASNPFDSFANLTSLYIDIYLPEVLDFIAKASFSLIELSHHRRYDPRLHDQHRQARTASSFTPAIGNESEIPPDI